MFYKDLVCRCYNVGLVQLKWAEKRFHISRSLPGHLEGENEDQTMLGHLEDELGGDGGVGTLVFSVPLLKVAAMNASPWRFFFFLTVFGCYNWLLKDLWPNFTSWVQTVTPSLITVLTHVTEVSKSYRRVKILLVSAVRHKPNSVMKGIYWLLRESPKVCRLQAQTKQPSQDVAHCHWQPYSYLPFFSQARQWLITATRVEVSRKKKKLKQCQQQQN